MGGGKLPAPTVDVDNLRGGGTSDYRTGVVTGAKPNLGMVSWFFCLGISVNGILSNTVLHRFVPQNWQNVLG